MSYWPALFIILAIAMAVGPIMIMQPSQRDRRLSSLRQTAANIGLQVRLSDYEGRSTAVYSLPVELSKGTPTWLLIKQSYEHGIHFHQKWQLSESSETIPSRVTVALKEFIDLLPADIVGIEVNKKIVGIWWREDSREITIDQIKDWLKRLYKTVS